MDNMELVKKYDGGLELHRYTKFVTAKRTDPKTGKVKIIEYPAVEYSGLFRRTKNGRLKQTAEARRESENRMMEKNGLPKIKLDMFETGAERLRNAIVAAAANDYRVLRYKTGNLERQQLEKFFLSDYFHKLTGLNGRMIMARLKDAKECVTCPLYQQDERQCGAMRKEDYISLEFDRETARPECCPIKQMNERAVSA